MEALVSLRGGVMLRVFQEEHDPYAWDLVLEAWVEGRSEQADLV